MWLDQAAGGVLTEGPDVVVDVQSNSVVVTTGGAVRAEDPRLAAVIARKGARTQPATDRTYVAKSCDPLHCAQAPMRGGIRLDVPRDDGTVGGCTTGFNVRSATTGAYYVLIAGHCVLGTRCRSAGWSARPAPGTPRPPGRPKQNYYAPVSSILDRANSRTGNTLGLGLLTAPTLKPPAPRIIRH